MIHPEPFDTDVDGFLTGPDGAELDVDGVFAKDFERVMEEFARDAPDEIALDPEDPGVPSMIDPDLVYREVPAGILLCDGRRPVGGYLSCDLSLEADLHGRGLGAEIVIERVLRDGCSPVWALDAAAYSPAGLAAHRSAWERARSNPEETRARMIRMMMEKRDAVGIIVRSGGELFDVETVAPRWNRERSARMPGIFDLSFRYNGRDAAELAGGGIYAIYFRRELLYVGIFTGHGKVPFAGNVAKERFNKHLEALTMRGRTVGFAEANYDKAIAMPAGPVVDALRTSTVPRGNGSVRSYPCKVAFATEHWGAMMRIGKDRSVLDDFTFLYARIGPEAFAVAPSYAELKNYINVIEDDVILDLLPRCNDKFTRSDRTKLRFGPDERVWDAFKAQVASLRAPVAKAA